MMVKAQAVDSEQTRTALLQAGRVLFFTKGFHETGTQEIVARAGVTRGALYHHFRNKADLFRAVIDIDDAAFWAAIEETARAVPDPFARIREACRAFLDACLNPAARRVVLLDPRAILGPERFRSEERPAMRMFAQLYQEALAVRAVRKHRFFDVASITLAMLREASVSIASSEDPRATRDSMAALVDDYLEGLRTGGRQRSENYR